jgi:transposase
MLDQITGLGMRSGSGRKPRLTEQERSRILSEASQPPPGRLERQAEELVARDELGSAQWTLDALAQAAKEAGIQVKRSQIRRIYIREGMRWHQTHSWGTSDDPDFVRNVNGGRHPLHATTRRIDDRLCR